MKAQVFRGVNQLSYEEVPVPILAADEVLVQVRVVGLCQSDIKKIRYPLYAPPRIFGHETAGTIAAIGSQVQGVASRTTGSRDAPYTMYALRLLLE